MRSNNAKSFNPALVEGHISALRNFHIGWLSDLWQQVLDVMSHYKINTLTKEFNLISLLITVIMHARKVSAT